MERNFETVMIEQCSPVLAGLKPANLFRYETRDPSALYATVAGWNAQFKNRGIRLLILKECPVQRMYLIYLYRPAQLGAVLSQQEVSLFLRQEGYALPKDPAAPAGCRALLAQLAGRLACGGAFPHEIGIFLGYPLADVVKSYGDPDAARRRFAQLNKCTAIYLRLFHSGTPILQLAVAA